MAISYKKLWKLLIDRDLKKKDLRQMAGISASSITKLGKGDDLLTALQVGFEMADASIMEVDGKRGAHKAVIFTESTRTQQYVLGLLNTGGYEGQVVLLNGSNNDEISKRIYAEWKERHKDDGTITSSKVPYYYIAFAMMIIIYLIMKKIDRSKLGFALRTIREDEDVASAIGIKPLKYKVIAVVISAMVSAFAGFFYASYYRYIDPDIMLQGFSVEMVLPAIIGGSAFVEGPLIGGIIMVSLSESLRNAFGAILPGINLILYAIVLIVVIRFRPTGILGWYNHSKLKGLIEYKVLGNQAEEEKPGKESVAA